MMICLQGCITFYDSLENEKNLCVSAKFDNSSDMIFLTFTFALHVLCTTVSHLATLTDYAIFSWNSYTPQFNGNLLLHRWDDAYPVTVSHLLKTPDNLLQIYRKVSLHIRKLSDQSW